jgi:hypothetical protein
MSQIPVSSLTVLHPAGDLGQPVKLLLGLHPICMVGRDGCCSILFRGKKSNLLVSHKQIFFCIPVGPDPIGRELRCM